MSKGQHALKYVYLELISTTDSKFDVVRGLFSGITTKEEKDPKKEADEFYILYYEKAGATSTSKAQPVTSLYNTKYYDVMHIEALKNDVKELIFFTKEDDDQEKAHKKLIKLLEEMREDERMYKNDEDIIDVAAYTDIPSDKVSTEEKKKDTSTRTNRRNTSAACGYNHTSGYNQGYNHNTGYNYQKKEPEMTVLKRSSGKKPTKEALETMQAKIDEIMGGTYVPELPELPVDDEPEDDKTDAQEDDYAGHYMM